MKDIIFTSVISLIAFYFRLSSHRFKEYWKYHNFDRDISEKHGINSLCIEKNKYTWFHKIGIVLSLFATIGPFFGFDTIYGAIVCSIFEISGFIFLIFYAFTLGKLLKEANSNLFHCVHLLNSCIYSITKGKYSNNPHWVFSHDVEASEADHIEILYKCCNFDRNMLIGDLIALGLFALNLFAFPYSTT